MREIVLDTETTGLDPGKGDRLVEIGAVEIVNQIATGAVFHALINPEREVPEEAFRVHGHSTASLADKPVFAAVVDDFLAFIGEDRLVIHNAEFDMRFLNAELATLGRPPIAADRVTDTLLAGAPQASRRAQQSRRAVRPLSHRPLEAGAPRRAARRRNSGRGLWRADRRPPALAVLRDGRGGARRRAGRGGEARAARAAAGAREPSRTRRPRRADRVARRSRRSGAATRRPRTARAARRSPSPRWPPAAAADRGGGSRSGRRRAADSRRCAPLGDDLAREREQQARALDHHQRLHLVGRDVLDAEHAGVVELELEDDVRPPRPRRLRAAGRSRSRWARSAGR